MALSITVLGSSGVYAGVDLACSGYLVRAPGSTVMMDAGPGTLANLQRHVSPTQLDAVLLSHSHPDHWLELPVLRNALKYVMAHPSPIDLYATAETLQLAERLCGELMPTFRPHVITDRSEFAAAGIDVRCSRTDHPVETLAFRVGAGGRSAAYTADTGPAWSVGELGRGLDLVISEATFLDGDEVEPAPVHLTAAQAGAFARAADAQRLAVTHVLPTGSVDAALAEAADAYGADVEHATMHRCLDV